MLGLYWSRIKGFAPLFFIALGIVSWRVTAPFGGVVPWIISSMLFFSVLNMSPRSAAPRPKHFLLLVLQLGIGAVLYFLLSRWNVLLATSLFMCFLAPAAAAAGAMTSLMDGDTGFATGYTIVTHGLICLLAPFLLPLLDAHSQLPFWTLSGQIALLVIRMVMLPISLAWLVRGGMKAMGKTPHPPKKLTYLLWLSSLIFILGKGVSFVAKEGTEQIGLLVGSFAVGLLACTIQFTLGSYLARRIGVDEVACRQSMGQKNTALTLWLCISFMHPLVAPGIAGYIAWQNFFLTYYMNRRSLLNR